MRSSLAAFVAGALAVWCSAATVRAQTTKLPAFTIDELKQLSTEAEPGGALATKLNRLLHTVETGSYVGKRDRPARPVQQGVPILRAAMWNIERGQEYDSILTALRSEERRVGKECRSRW